MHTSILLYQLPDRCRRLILRAVIDIPKLQLYLLLPKKLFILYKFLIKISNIIFLVITGDNCAEYFHFHPSCQNIPCADIAIPNPAYVTLPILSHKNKYLNKSTH